MERNINYKALAPFVQRDVVDDYNKWLKQHPTVLFSSSNVASGESLQFTCTKCGNTDNISTDVPGSSLNKELHVTEWECSICTGEEDSRRFGRARTIMLRLN